MSLSGSRGNITLAPQDRRTAPIVCAQTEHLSRYREKNTRLYHKTIVAAADGQASAKVFLPPPPNLNILLGSSRSGLKTRQSMPPKAKMVLSLESWHPIPISFSTHTLHSLSTGVVHQKLKSRERDEEAQAGLSNIFHEHKMNFKSSMQLLTRWPCSFTPYRSS